MAPDATNMRREMAQSKSTRKHQQAGIPEMTAAFATLNPWVAKSWLEMVSESTRFVTERLQEDLKTQRAMMACRTPAELMQVQTEFCRTAVEQYSAEVTRLFGMMSQAADEGVREVTAGHTRKHDDVPL